MLHRIVAENIATGLPPSLRYDAGTPYPKIEKTVPQFLTRTEYKRLIRRFTDRADSPNGPETSNYHYAAGHPGTSNQHTDRTEH